ncbi:ankyrin repeat domain-containing protein [Chloropicon primus]|uniref:Uncharacterized protein n=2 Tax=Chloropicon primus TaxID=1764295 RepID=A0A5B8MF31_9CHLO|nr:hypothetical protein A3770_02p15570 [Chloropicon primus]UPQ98248.1 ankyrin repeat domain-containing protein [Chloropicon primus]|eukprot:QDZ19039.1 hypothetical protein A3770_02p15570 [Chloropicon primus]
MEEAVGEAWGEGGGRDFGKAWRHLGRRPEDVNVSDERGRTVLHCCCVLPDDRGRAVLINNLLAAGADPSREDRDGWAPIQSDFVLEAQGSWEAWSSKFRATGRSRPCLEFLLEEAGATRAEGTTRAQQALWSSVSRHNVNRRLGGQLGGRTPLHLACEALGVGVGGALDLQGVGEEAGRERLTRWSARRALAKLRGEAAAEDWTTCHDLVCLLLDLGADAERRDDGGRRPLDLLPPGRCDSVRALLESDWELGEKTGRGTTLAADSGDVVDGASGLVVAEGGGGDPGAANGAPEDPTLASEFARLSVDLLASDVEEEGLYRRVERAEAELREWRRVNARALGRMIEAWPAEDAARNFGEWGKGEGLDAVHPARRRRGSAVAVVVEESAGEVESVEREVEYELEYAA